VGAMEKPLNLQLSSLPSLYQIAVRNKMIYSDHVADEQGGAMVFMVQHGGARIGIGHEIHQSVGVLQLDEDRFQAPAEAGRQPGIRTLQLVSFPAPVMLVVQRRRAEQDAVIGPDKKRYGLAFERQVHEHGDFQVIEPGRARPPDMGAVIAAAADDVIDFRLPGK